MKRVPLKSLPLAVALLVAPLTASAADGRIPIGTVPYTISAPGSYYLTADLTYAATASAITIAASDVSLDLNGHTIRETSSTYGAFCVSGGGCTNIRISNGILVGGYGAVVLQNLPAGLVRVEGITASPLGDYGIYILGNSSSQPAVRVTNNAISFNGATGTNPGGISIGYVSGGEISGNTLIGNGTSAGYGIIFNPANGLLVAGNVAYSFEYGIWVQGGGSCKVLKNNASQDSIGITVWSTNGVEVQENFMANNGTGLLIPAVTNCVYRDNTAQANTTNYQLAGSGITNGGGNY